MPTRGVIYVAIGPKAEAEYAKARQRLEHVHPEMPIMVIGDTAKMTREQMIRTSRAYKTRLDHYSPWDQTLYMDADTRVLGPIDVGFKILEDGWDLVLTPSLRQTSDWCWHLTDAERKVMSRLQPMAALQGGMMWWRAGTKSRRFFQKWNQCWNEWKGQDQGALMRSLPSGDSSEALKIWLLSQHELLDHRWGHARP